MRVLHCRFEKAQKTTVTYYINQTERDENCEAINVSEKENNCDQVLWNINANVRVHTGKEGVKRNNSLLNIN